MSLTDIFRDNVFERFEDDEAKMTFRRTEAAWRIFANQQERLDIKRWKSKTPPGDRDFCGSISADTIAYFRKSSGYKLSAQKAKRYLPIALRERVTSRANRSSRQSRTNNEVHQSAAITRARSPLMLRSSNFRDAVFQVQRFDC
jgi:hypothetical protein